MTILDSTFDSKDEVKVAKEESMEGGVYWTVEPWSFDGESPSKMEFRERLTIPRSLGQRN